MSELTDYERGFAEAIEKAADVADAEKHRQSALRDELTSSEIWGSCNHASTVAGQIATAIRALSPSPDTVLVPREPTPEMVNAGTDARWASAVRDANNVREIWRAMIAEVK
jgi:hypothetical protein